MLECWCVDPDTRPSFTYLRSKFDAILLEENQYIQFASIDEEHSRYDRLSPLSSNGEQSKLEDLGTTEVTPLPSKSTDQDTQGCDVGSTVPWSSYVANPYVHTPTRLSHQDHFQLDGVAATQALQQFNNLLATQAETEEEEKGVE